MNIVGGKLGKREESSLDERLKAAKEAADKQFRIDETAEEVADRFGDRVGRHFAMGHEEAGICPFPVIKQIVEQGAPRLEIPVEA